MNLRLVALRGSSGVSPMRSRRHSRNWIPPRNAECSVEDRRFPGLTSQNSVSIARFRPESTTMRQPRLGQGLQSYEDRPLTASSCRARTRTSCDSCAQRAVAQNSDSCNAGPSAGIWIASRKWPAVRSSISDFKRSVSLSAVSSHASHPQVGKALLYRSQPPASLAARASTSG
jgi:hypothetical protein